MDSEKENFYLRKFYFIQKHNNEDFSTLYKKSEIWNITLWNKSSFEIINKKKVYFLNVELLKK